MRLTPVVFVSFVLAGCQQSFDEQYSETEKELAVEAEKLDAEMAQEAAKEAQPAKR